MAYVKLTMTGSYHGVPLCAIMIKSISFCLAGLQFA